MFLVKYKCLLFIILNILIIFEEITKLKHYSLDKIRPFEWALDSLKIIFLVLLVCESKTRLRSPLIIFSSHSSSFEALCGVGRDNQRRPEEKISNMPIPKTAHFVISNVINGVISWDFSSWARSSSISAVYKIRMRFLDIGGFKY